MRILFANISMMFSRRTTFFLLTIITILQTTIRAEATNVDDVVRYCEEKEGRFSASEDKYVKRGRNPPNRPQLFPIVQNQTTAYQIELSQRIFECISESTKTYRGKNFLKNEEYHSFAQKCTADRPKIPECDISNPYRTINGACNNVNHPRWGSTLSCFRRLWPANYEGAAGLRKSVQEGKPLPNTREISRELVKPVLKQSDDFNALFAFIGQALAHDIAKYVFTQVDGNKRLDCCKNSSRNHIQCAPIDISPSDTFYSKQNVNCFNFIRVSPCGTCSAGKRLQLNGVTAFIDCSLVYGETEDRARSIRRNDGSGKLKTQITEAGELIPPDRTSGSRCGDAKNQEYCFIGGDDRANQQTPLIIFQTLLLLEHNRIADELKRINSHWDEEKLYQEARKILIAEWQVIIYKEYLPILIGSKLMSEHGLNIGCGSSYDSSVRPLISNEFNAASFRVHSLLPRKVVYDEEDELLRYHYANAVPIYDDRMSAYLFKMANIEAEQYDWFMPKDVTQYLYRTLQGKWGFDLAAVDIQRGRDVGLPTYVQIIEHMEDNEPLTIKTFDDLDHYIVQECINIFKNIYDDVRDVDFYVGILCEKIPEDMIISPTAAWIIAEQFRRLKYGDRFYFEHDDSFTSEQQEALKAASFSKFICDNTEVQEIQPVAFLFPNNKNPFQDCSSIPGVDLEKWRE